MDGLDRLERIAEAVLYEGYVLWPYRRSARKNQQRWTFGGVYPRGFCEAARSGDVWRIQVQCLVEGSAPVLDVELRCLQLVERRVARPTTDGGLEFVDELRSGSAHILAWDEAVERRWPLPGPVELPAAEGREQVDGGVVVRGWQTLTGSTDVRLEALAANLWRVTATLENASDWSGTDRAAAQGHSFLSAHLVLRVRAGDFVSATDPPAEIAEAVGACENVGVWPVLVGADGERNTLLASPIILYDYPQIAPESPTLLFDSGEIDQMLMLNTLALTDAEKAEIRATDPRTRAILERAESLTAGDFRNLHGALRDFRVVRSDPSESPVSTAEPAVYDDLTARLEAESARLLGLERPTPSAVFVDGVLVQPGSTVRLRPRQGADVFDLALAGRTATVESIEQDYEDRVHLAVTLQDDPGADLGALRMPGHRFFFAPEEVEPLT